ncbi:uncharacterized protein PFL1_03645 [Pseudozyma flocculosa PF-1]|uniref:Ribosome biogenesis protein SLX9 n=2 Tax=Pseudozyma flocculosa TaxID=84751 RepID=A0A5C3F6Q3_9BASI|nr:uncharacterized protein PFL1_03645 [Pseudozyma flocculosa PF-1]EPQ28842.1 hypothetical protein PFL1_03645 [Pseudozyma flocculosa PF-1]SPO39367.1 uncharacterized protein PSFLO_04848 [Pseudozyma flocculosa]
MVRADQGIRGRAAPRSKTRSSSAPSSTTSPSSVATPSGGGVRGQQISKAAKRALKRAELVSQARSASDSSSSSRPVLNLGGPGEGGKPLSKSSLKRLKKKQRNNLAGNRQGLKDLEDVVDDLKQQIAPVAEGADEEADEETMQDGDDDDVFEAQVAAEHASHVAASVAAAQHRGVGSQGAKDGVVTEKAKKKALAHEMMRQPHILSDPAYAKNPFAALRLHAQNTLAFDQSASLRAKHATTAAAAAAGNGQRRVDVDMA